MAALLDSPGQQLLADGMNLKEIQPADIFADNLLVIIASAIGLVVLVTSLISCICCIRGNARRASSSDSLRDTVQLEDLLSKPTLADPESVFSEFLWDAKISEDASSQTAATMDETTQNSVVSSRSSSVLDSYDEPRGKAINTTGSKNYKKGSKNKSNAGLNNSSSHGNSVYKKNSRNSQTLQNDLSYVSSKRKKVQNKLEHYDRKATESLQEEGEFRSDKTVNIDKEKEDIDLPETDQQQQQFQFQERKTSLEVLDLDMQRASSGSECVSFTSSARGSLCHDIGTPANAFRLHRPSIYPRTEGGSRTEGKRDGADDEVCSLPNVLEIPVESQQVAIQSQDDVDNNILPGRKDDDGDKTMCGKTPDMSTDDSSLTTCQNEHTKDLGCSQKTKWLQKAYSIDKPLNDPQKCRKLPDRISLNLQIDFHFTDQSPSRGEGAIPIVVCSPLSINSTPDAQNNQVPAISQINPEHHETTCCNAMRSGDDEEDDKSLKSDKKSQLITASNSINTHNGVTLEDTRNSETTKTTLETNPSLQMTPIIPSWVKNRLSEPVEVCNLIKKVSSLPRLKKRSFTIADFKSLKLRTFANIYDEGGEDRSRKIRSLIGQLGQDETELKHSDGTDEKSSNLSRSDIDITGTSTCEKRDYTKEINLESTSQSNDTKNGVEVENIVSDSVLGSGNEHSEVVASQEASNTTHYVNIPTSDELSNSDTESQHYEKPTLEIGENIIEVKTGQANDKALEMDTCENSDEESEYYMESDSVFDNIEDKRRFMNGKDDPESHRDEHKRENDQIPKDRVMKVDEDDLNSDKIVVMRRSKSLKADYKRSMSLERDSSMLRGSIMGKDRCRITRSSSLGFIPYVPFVPTVLVMASDGTLIRSNERVSTSSFTPPVTNEEVNYSVPELEAPEVSAEVKEAQSPGPKDITSGDDSNSDESKRNPVCSDSITDPSHNNGQHSNETMEAGECQTFPRGKPHEPQPDGHGILEIGSSQTYPKSKASRTGNDNHACSGEFRQDQSSTGLIQQKARSADTTMDGDTIEADQGRKYPASIDMKASSADTTIDTNVASDESDYDNPWDSIDNAVKRASMKYHKRPSVAASSVRDLMLQSAEDLGRLIEMADKRHRDRLASTKSTCHELQPDSDPAPIFTRSSPLRHTVKGVLSFRESNEDLGSFGAKPKRGKAGSKSLRASKDDSVHNMKTADDSKLGSGKYWKVFHSPETKKKTKK